MSKVGNEITRKLKNDIKSKLNEIGAYVDNELPDYIMVMVANQKSRYQMKDDLSLFLGKNTDDFVDWLHEALKSMQEKISANENSDAIGKKKNKSGKQTSGVENSGLNENPLKKHEVSELNKSVDEINNKEQNMRYKLKENNGLTNSHDDKVNDDRNSQQKVNAPSVVNHFPEDSSMSTDKGDDQEVVLRLNDDTGDADELLQESPLTADNAKKSTSKLISNNTVPALLAKQELHHEVEHRTPMSTIGAVVTNEPMFVDDDDDEDMNMKSVSSVVKIKERKSSVPVEKQANKLLILRAVQEATQSVSGTFKRKLAEDYTPTPIVKKRTRQADYSLDPSDLRHYLKANRLQELESNFPSDAYNKEDEENCHRRMESPKFFVTLDGVHKRFGSNNEESDLINDELTLGEEIDEEFVEIENSFEEKEQKDEEEKKIVVSGKNKEKCKYWPSCTKGDECLYHHPNSPCKSFPNCRFGEKCLFIHPQCKYNTICAKPECPFVHSSKKPAIGSKAPTAASLLAPCKFYPNCTNASCPFVHPKPCIFGSKCRNSVCKYSHPFNFFASNLPKPHQLKWKAKEQSEQKLGDENNQQMKVVESPATN